MKKGFGIILLLFVTLVSFTQTQPDVIFRNLEDGAILVRLKTKSKIIKSLEGKNDELAAKIKAEQQNESASIIDAFSSVFHYCDVYYFNTEDSKKVRSRQFKGVLFDKHGNALNEIPDLKDNYLIAEFGQTQGDSLQQDTQIKTYDEENNLVNIKDTTSTYYTGIRFDALVLLTPNMQMLQDPYPHFVRKGVVVKSRTHAEMIAKMQDKIVLFNESTRNQ